jgi:phospholipid/cholesterol/gamma-HCH transport system substrate-binding protein
VITRQTKLQLLAFAVVAVLGMSYLGFKYVGLDRLVLGSGYDVAADFTDSAASSSTPRSPTAASRWAG